MNAIIGRIANIKIILSLFVGLGIIYSVVTPIFEAPDEWLHYPVVKYIADGYGLPVQHPGDQTTWKQEGNQPPLYYVLMAAATAWIDTGDMRDRLYQNPHAAIGNAGLEANRNLIVHTSAENFPWHNTTLAIHLIRLLSIVIGAFTVALGYLIARRLFPERRSIAVGVAALIAFNPMFISISASVNNDNLVILLSTSIIYTLVLCWQEPGGNLNRELWSRRIVIGVLAGLAALSKASGLTLLPIIAVFLTIRHLRRRDWRGWLLSGAVIAALTIIIAGWWFLRNYQLYGEWLGTATLVAAFGPRIPPATLPVLISEFDGFRVSYWAVLGIFNIRTFAFAYVIFDAFTAIGVFGWIIYLVQAWRRSDRDRFWLMLSLALFALIVFSGVVSWTIVIAASQGRLMFPAIAVISLLLWLGWDTLWSMLPKNINLGRWLLPAFLVVISIVIPFRDILPAYAQPTFLTVDQLPGDLKKLNVDYGQTLRLIGYELPGSPSIDQSIQFTLYWQCLTRPLADYSVFVIAYGRDLAQIGKRDAFPERGLYATRECEQGTIFSDPYNLPIDPAAVRPSVVQVQIGLKDWNTKIELKPAIGSKEIPALVFIAGKIPPAIDSQLSATDLARFDDNIFLNRIDVPAHARAGARLPIKLYWRSTAAIPESFTVFVHLMDEQGNTVAQGDGVPANNYYPTNWWSSGETIQDQHDIQLKADLLPGTYRVAIGLYRLADGTRLPVIDAAGNLQPDAQFIFSVPISISR